MARYNQDWDDLGRNIQDIVDRAVNSHDYQKLNQTIRQVVDRAVDLGSEAVRKAKESSRADIVEEGPAYQDQKRSAAPKNNLPVLYGSTSGKTAGAIVSIIGGSLMGLFSLFGYLATVVFDMMFGIAVSGMGILTIAFLVLGAALIGGGIGTLGKLSRFKTYRKVLGQKTYCTLEKLAQSVGKNVKFVRRDVRRMIRDGLFLEGSLDREGTQLITSHETYQYFEQSRLQLEERQRQEAAEQARKAASPHTPQVQEVLDRGNMFITEIRRCNDAIPGAEISAKIDRIEMIVRRIFQRAEANPEIIPDLKKMMDYYLPMTVKLLDAYAEMDSQPVQGDTIQASKREIEGTLDTLNLAFEKLLDDLFADTAMDISSDISVLNTLLAQEGLTDDDLSKMKKQQNV